MQAKPTRPLLVPLFAAILTAAAVLLLFANRREARPHRDAQVAAPRRSHDPYADFRVRYCKLAADIEAANERFPFDAEGSDLAWSRFLELYGATGRVAEYEHTLRTMDLQLAPSTLAMLEHTHELRITLFGDAWELEPQLPLELQVQPTDPKHRRAPSSPAPPKCALRIGSRRYPCGMIYAAQWRAGHQDVALEFWDEDGFTARTDTATGPWALLRMLKRGEVVDVENDSWARLRYESQGAPSIDLLYRWVAGVESQQTQKLLTSPVPVPKRLLAGDSPCDGS